MSDPLQWSDPVTHADGGYVKSLCGRFSVVKERRSGGTRWRYVPFMRSAVLDRPVSSLDVAKSICQQHA